METQTEVVGRLKSAFVLDETQVRRLAEAVASRLKEANSPNASVKWDVRFLNGATSHSLSTDALLDLENEDSHRVVSVKLVGRQQTNEGTTLREIAIDIEDLDSADSRSKYPMGWEVKSPARDWAFVTSSEIKERLQSTRSPNPQRFLTGDAFMLGYWVCAMIFFLILLPFFERADAPDYPEYPDVPEFEVPATVEPVSDRMRELFRQNPPESFADALLVVATAEEDREQRLSSTPINTRRRRSSSSPSSRTPRRSMRPIGMRGGMTRRSGPSRR